MTDDERLIAELAEAVRVGGEVPPDFVAAGKALFAWRTVDADLATLTHDSAADPVGAGTRAEPGARALTFVSGDLSVELELTGDTLLGQVVPPESGRVELHGIGGRVAEVPVDESGWFALRGVPAPMFRLSVHTGAGTLVTEWIRG
jgi:hypothetical protein